jgi:hypothetical protein
MIFWLIADICRILCLVSTAALAAATAAVLRERKQIHRLKSKCLRCPSPCGACPAGRSLVDLRKQRKSLMTAAAAAIFTSLLLQLVPFLAVRSISAYSAAGLGGMLAAWTLLYAGTSRSSAPQTCLRLIGAAATLLALTGFPQLPL